MSGRTLDLSEQVGRIHDRIFCTLGIYVLYERGSHDDRFEPVLVIVMYRSPYIKHIVGSQRRAARPLLSLYEECSTITSFRIKPLSPFKVSPTEYIVDREKPRLLRLKDLSGGYIVLASSCLANFECFRSALTFSKFKCLFNCVHSTVHAPKATIYGSDTFSCLN